MRSAYFGALLGLILAAHASAAAADLDRVMDALAQHVHGHASFVEEDHLALLERPVVSSGELFYDRPDRLEKRTLAPRARSVILEHGTLTIQTGAHKRVLALRDYPQLAPFIESLRATLAGDRHALEQIFELTFDGDFERWSLALVPLDAKLKGIVARIRIEGARDELQAVSIFQPDGDKSMMRIGTPITP
jgi:hypothetical protein